MRTCDDFGILDRQKTLVELFFKTLKRKFWKKLLNMVIIQLSMKMLPLPNIWRFQRRFPSQHDQFVWLFRCGVKAEQLTGATSANNWVTHCFISKKELLVEKKKSEKGIKNDVNAMWFWTLTADMWFSSPVADLWFWTQLDDLWFFTLVADLWILDTSGRFVYRTLEADLWFWTLVAHSWFWKIVSDLWFLILVADVV